MHCMRHIQNSIYYRKVRYFQSYSGPIQTFSAPAEPCVTLAYSEPCHIQNSGIFWTQNIFKTLPKHILAYLERCVALAQWKPWHIRNFGIFRMLDIFNDDNYNNMNFLFFHLILRTFQRNLKSHMFFWLQSTESALRLHNLSN